MTHFLLPKTKMALEYLFYFMLLSPLLIITEQWLYLAIIPALCILIAQLPRPKNYKRSNSSKFRLKFIPLSSYEWISGLRRNKITVLLLFTLSLSLSFLPAASLFICWFLSMVIMSFYFPYEPPLLISQQEKSAQLYLYEKTSTALKYSVLLFILPIGLYILFNPDDYPKALMVLVICVLNPQMTIIRKYQQYQPRTDFSGNATMLMLLQIIMFNPVVIMLSVLYTSLAYAPAVNNLKTYCHDKDQ